MSSPAEILKSARARIADPKNWTQREFARDATGYPCLSWDGKATCWCAYGAVEAEVGEPDSDPENYLWAAARDLHGSADVTVVTVNDHMGHAAVLALYDRAIELAEAQS